MKLEYPVAKRVNASTIVTRSQNFRQLPLVCITKAPHSVSFQELEYTFSPHYVVSSYRFFIYGSESDRKHRSLESLLQSHLHKFSEVQSFKGTSIMQWQGVVLLCVKLNKIMGPNIMSKVFLYLLASLEKIFQPDDNSQIHVFCSINSCYSQ